MAENNSKTLVDEKLAVSLFLDSLLRETETEPADIVETEVTEPNEQVTAELSQPSQPPEDAVEQVTDTDSIQSKTLSQSIESSAHVDSEVEKPVTGAAEELPHPEWANAPFQVLLFNVAGLKIAVPLIELCAVIKWTDRVTEMPGHADFYMGILQHLEYKIAVIDTAKMIIPVDKQSELVEENPRDRVNHIVLIDNYRWGLACDKIGEVITLKPEDVRWRKSNSKRTWLAGTVIEHMCALLNSDGFASMLEKG